jgi:4-aminobutyrate aminotransferase
VQRKGFGPVTTPGVFHAPYPDVYRAPTGTSADQVAAESIAWIEDRLFVNLVPPDEVAAIVVEPIQGEGGYIVPPPTFLPRLAELARKHGILVVADEVQSGMGRTGKMFACEHFGLRPDIVSIAKGIASGLPLGVTASRADVMDWTPGAHASTFGGNPVACAAASATIRLLERELIANAATVGEHMAGRLRDLMGKHRLIGDVRGRGLMIGVELVTDRETKARAVEERELVVDRMFAKGVLALGAGRNTIRFCPPLVLSKAQADCAVEAFDQAVGEVAKERGLA